MSGCSSVALCRYLIKMSISSMIEISNWINFSFFLFSHQFLFHHFSIHYHSFEVFWVIEFIEKYNNLLNNLTYNFELKWPVSRLLIRTRTRWKMGWDNKRDQKIRTFFHKFDVVFIQNRGYFQPAPARQNIDCSWRYPDAVETCSVYISHPGMKNVQLSFFIKQSYKASPFWLNRFFKKKQPDLSKNTNATSEVFQELCARFKIYLRLLYFWLVVWLYISIFRKGIFDEDWKIRRVFWDFMAFMKKGGVDYFQYQIKTKRLSIL